MSSGRLVLLGAAAILVLALLFVALRREGDGLAGPSKGSEGSESTGEPWGDPVASAATKLALDSSAGPRRTTMTAAERDELAKKIHRALWTETGKSPSAADLATAPANVPALSPAYVRERIREDLAPMAVACYEDLLVKHPDAGGLANMEFTIVADEKLGAIVEDTKLGEGSTMVDPAFTTCLLASLSTVSFRAPEKGGKTTVRYPLSFSPDDEDAEAGAAEK